MLEQERQEMWGQAGLGALYWHCLVCLGDALLTPMVRQRPPALSIKTENSFAQTVIYKLPVGWL